MGRDPLTEWVLPLVLRLERDTPPRRTDALEAAALAVLHMLTTDEPEWLEAVRAWDGSRIRKVVRRARGADWRRARALPGVTIARRTARVRVYPPIPVDGWPPELARLQVSGTELADPKPLYEPKLGQPYIYVNPDVPMTAGKAMAQVGHAAHLGWRAMGERPSARFGWQLNGFPLSVRTPRNSRLWNYAMQVGVVVRDAGFTEVEPDTPTAVFSSY